MNEPRWPPVVLRADNEQISLALDCKHPLCVMGWQEVLLYVGGLDLAGVRRVLAQAARERAYCYKHQPPLRTLEELSSPAPDDASPKASKAARKPSWQILRLLHNLAEGRSETNGIRGQSAYGGLQGTLVACIGRGWIEKRPLPERDTGSSSYRLTPAGVAIEAKHRR